MQPSDVKGMRVTSYLCQRGATCLALLHYSRGREAQMRVTGRAFVKGALVD